jgi:DNA-directed RNA polymerase subunit beta'
MPYQDNISSSDFDAIALKVASPEKVREWSYGEVTKPETINYRTQRPEKGGLFAEEIFGPTKDFQCYCGKYKKIRYKGIVCDKCGTEVTHSSVRRKRMGHIELEAPVTHIWFLRSIPSKLGIILDMSVKDIEKVVYFASFIITDVDYAEKENVLEDIEQEFETKRQKLQQESESKIEQFREEGADKSRIKQVKEEKEEKIEKLREDMEEAKEDLSEIDRLNIVSENEYQELSVRFGHLFKAEIGAEAIRNLLKNLDIDETIDDLDKEIEERKGAKRKRLIRRRKVLASLKDNDIEPEWTVMTNIPIIPPELRPMVPLDGGRFATSDINDLYRRVINRNNRLKRLNELNAPEVICRNEKRMLQEAVDSMIDNSSGATKTVTSGSQDRELRSLADIVKGKSGRFRQNLLGKRVDYSGRSVIVVGPDLDINECGIPKKMAIELYKPHVISKIIDRELAHNVKSAKRFIEERNPEVWDILEEVVEGTRVLLNRAPTLHRLGIQAFKPRLIDGKAIQLHPLVCPGYNADFDGDQMAVHLPITEEAKWEAENLMAGEKNVLKPATGDPIMTPQQDITLGCYYLTKYKENSKDEVENYFANTTEARYAYDKDKIDLKEKIKVRFKDDAKFEEEQPIVTTSIGRVIFNDVLPDELPYYNEKIRTDELGDIIDDLLDHHTLEQTARILDDIKELGFDYVTQSGYSLCTSHFQKIEEKGEILKEGQERVDEVEQQYMEGLLTDSERKSRVIEIWTDVKDKVLSHNKETVDKSGPIYAMIDSKARGSWGQLGQVVGMKGLVASPSGEIIELPVRGNFKEGFSVLEYFISSHGTRKGLSDTALRTASAGYLTRRLVDVAQDVIVSQEDCGDQQGEVFTREGSQYMGEELAKRVEGRFVLNDVTDSKDNVIVESGDVITEEDANQIRKRDVDQVHVRSVLQCNLEKNVCVKCYGYDLGMDRVSKTGFPAGIIAAQSVGEPGTQLTMNTFHHGGAASGADITQGLPRVEELFEARNPKGEAVLTEVAGTVEVEDADGKIITSSSGRKKFEGRKGQKIIKIHFKEMDEESIRLRKSDDMKVEEGENVEEGDVLFVHGTTGEKVKAEYDGKVEFEDKKLILNYRGAHTKEYVTPVGHNLLVEDGDEVEKGEQLTEGSVDPEKLYELKDREAVQRLLLKEIQEVYASQGQKINGKHIEIIIKKMFSRAQVQDPGDTDLLPGETVEKVEIQQANSQLNEDQQPAEAKELFKGISKVALSTQSFLSAASFQETSKVLINAALRGKVDPLTGLKENVIIGRMVPVGTGFDKEEYQQKIQQKK